MKLPKKKCKKVLSKKKVAKGSYRWKKSGSSYLLIGCPVGEWMPRKKRCKVGTFAVEQVKAAGKNGACPTGLRRVR